MAEEPKKNFSKWLETLQQESWQLELIISGFAIFLLLGASTPIENWYYAVEKLQTSTQARPIEFLKLGMLLIYITWYVLVVNLIVHVLLRGLWISTIGLRSVSGDIDFDTLDFNPKFDLFLRKKIISFDHYVGQLEKICSVIFGFTFLIVFIALSIGIFISFLLGFIFLIEYFDQQPNSIIALSLLVIFIIIFFGSLIYVIDFLTLGWLKKQKRLAKIYYPIYRFYSFLTLSFIYRPLYYNLIDNKFGRWVGLLVIPYLIVFMGVSLLKVDTHGYLPMERKAQSIRNKYYDDIRPEKKADTWSSIPSKYVKNGYVELYIPYISSAHDLAIQATCPDLQSGTTGVGFDFSLDKRNDPRSVLNADSALTCISELHQVYIDDSLRSDATYHFYEHPKRNDLGLLTILDVNYLGRGEHQIVIKSKFKYSEFSKDSLSFKQTDVIPFWKE